ncbi:unnamed protein product [Ambrosiozyma monospora]|uniref:Unnamed protein product n=1 Tax=Ambrosiozyma monospora TaxID=43982 RepID=A0A9W6Z1V8_AMBMO|nr:unnamed protein product [Ambrosiozyma monospora]
MMISRDLKFPRIIENEALSSELIGNFLKGDLLQQLKQISPPNEQLDSGLLLMCFIIELSNGFDPTSIKFQVEEYLIREGILVDDKPTVIQDDDDMTTLKMVEFYLFCVLPKLNQHDVSKKYIKVLFSYDEARVTEYLDKLEALIKDEKQHEHHHSHVQESPEQTNGSLINGTKGINGEPPRSKKNHYSPKKLNKNGTLTSRFMSASDSTTPISAVTDTSNSSSTLSQLKLWYEKLFGRFSSTNNVVKLAVLLSFLVSFLISLKFTRVGRRNLITIRQCLLWIIRKFKETLQMGFKISYV